MTLLKLNVPATFARNRAIPVCQSAKSVFLNYLIIKQHPGEEQPWKTVGKTTCAFPVLPACFGVLVTTLHESESCDAGYLGQCEKSPSAFISQNMRKREN